MAWVPTEEMEERGPDTLRPKGVRNRRSQSTLKGPFETQSSMSRTPMNWSTSPPRSGSARVTSWRAGELMIASRLEGTVVEMSSGTTMKLKGLVWKDLKAVCREVETTNLE